MAPTTRLLPLLTWRAAICESSLPPTARHVALTLSLYMSEKGDSAFPGAVRLAHDTGLSERAVRGNLGTLVRRDWLRLVHKGGGRAHANAYQAHINEADRRPYVKDAPDAGFDGNPADSDSETLQIVTVNPAPPAPHLYKNSPVTLATASRPRERDLLFEAICTSCGLSLTDLTPTARGPLNRAVKELRAIGATPRDVESRASSYRRLWPTAVLTPIALAKHWAGLGSGPLSDSVPPPELSFEERRALMTEMGIA